mmetsp:Transcript_109942/g.164454  ORF Transcript_109942/g.164454 Transcript_109942/m.164454 type:complete len:81 (+) Transcript_109942:220-462(+)
MRTCQKRCNKTQLMLPQLRYRSTISRRMLRRISKRNLTKKYTPTWHVIVGRNFGSYVTHETKHFIYFYLGQVAILLFKSG